MQRKEKIIIVTRNMTAGGAEQVIAQLANYFVRRGYKCVIITMDREKVMYDLDSRIKFREVGIQAKNKVVDRVVRYALLRKMIKEERPNIVLTMPEDTGIYVILSLIGIKVPVYVSERNNPWVMPDSSITRFLRKIAYPFATGIIFQTEMAKSFFSKRIQQKGIVLANPVDSERIPEPFAGKREKTIVSVGRLAKQKNFSLLIRAFSSFCKEYPDYKLVIYGEGPERKYLEKLVFDLQLEQKVIMPGRNKDVLNEINSAKMFVMSSDYEGMPNALIEAMCMGMPVIATDCPSGGPRELIRNGENGLLIDVNNVEDMEKAMKQIVDGRSEELGKRAYVTGKKLMNPKVFEDWKAVLFCEKVEDN